MTSGLQIRKRGWITTGLLRFHILSCENLVCRHPSSWVFVYLHSLIHLVGANIVKRAVSYPLKLIAKNVGNGTLLSEKFLVFKAFHPVCKALQKNGHLDDASRSSKLLPEFLEFGPKKELLRTCFDKDKKNVSSKNKMTETKSTSKIIKKHDSKEVSGPNN